MPELPEVESVRRCLEPRVRGALITEAQFLDPRSLPGNCPAKARAWVTGKTIEGLNRLGKYLVFHLAGGHYMVVHLRMTGRLYTMDTAESAGLVKLAAVFRLDNGTTLCFQDTRRFGTIYLGSDELFHSIGGLQRLGPDPTASDWDHRAWAAQLQKRRAPVKSLLLNQQLLAGLGNIYADESLFCAGIHPRRPGSSLTDADLRRLASCIRSILLDAIEHEGTTIRDFRNGYNQTGSFQGRLQVYKRTDQPCRHCGKPVEKLKLAGRSSHFCPACQKELPPW